MELARKLQTRIIIFAKNEEAASEAFLQARGVG